MKIRITEDSKKVITLEDVKTVKNIISELKEEDIKADLSILASMFKADTPKEYQARIATNIRVYDALMENSKHFDIWIDTELPETYENGKWVIYKIGFYLTDLWSVSAENAKEIKKYMYIRKFAEC